MYLRVLVVAGVFVVVGCAAAGGFYLVRAPHRQTALAPIAPATKPVAVDPVTPTTPTKSITNFHANAVAAFGMTPGFGKGRVPIMKSQIEHIYVQWSPGEIEDGAPPIEAPELAKAHKASIGVFSTDPAKRIGAPLLTSSLHYDRPTQTWRLDKVDLVALVDHEQPTVYITENLPLRKADAKNREDYMRDLDVFEMIALDKLNAGENTFVRAKDDAMRMVGALRASKACLECHAGKEGDLFGAFSYTLERVER